MLPAYHHLNSNTRIIRSSRFVSCGAWGLLAAACASHHRTCIVAASVSSHCRQVIYTVGLLSSYCRQVTGDLLSASYWRVTGELPSANYWRVTVGELLASYCRQVTGELLSASYWRVTVGVGVSPGRLRPVQRVPTVSISTYNSQWRVVSEDISQLT